jgi:[NiFe] hydrogenase diaphorase moiety small subunit
MTEITHFMIDGERIPFRPGQTIMDAALAAGVYIPHLCHNPALAPHGSCRVCVVRANGREVSACTMPAAANLEVESETEAVRALRVAILQMLFVEGNHVCPACERSGACQLQAVAYYCGMLEPRFTHFFPRRALDASHPDVVLDRNRCILCELCVRASRDLDGKRVFAVSGRGIDSRLIVDSPTGRLGDSRLAVTDRAAHVCPVGALMPRQRAGEPGDRRGYRVPIGDRLYDREPISCVGDVALHDRGPGAGAGSHAESARQSAVRSAAGFQPRHGSEPEPKSKPEPVSRLKPEPKSKPEPVPRLEPKSKPRPEAAPGLELKPKPKPELKLEPEQEQQSEPEPTVSAAAASASAQEDP